MKTKINENIRLLRLQRGYSQENMADLLHLSTTAYGDIERGKTDITLSRLEQIAQVLGVDSASLLLPPSPPAVSQQAFEAVPVTHQATPTPDMSAIQLLLEKQQLEIEKLTLEVENWKRRYERAVTQEQLTRELINALTPQPAPARERIGF